uniref:Uncharacterized protein n=1 Tax=Chelonoidis abingdonii TaxID=106734 RepID=A0A8C0GT25_CHEAB
THTEGELTEQNPLDAVLRGRGWEVQERYNSAPAPTHPVRVQQTVCYINLAALLNDQIWGSLYVMWPLGTYGGPCASMNMVKDLEIHQKHLQH